MPAIGELVELLYPLLILLMVASIGLFIRFFAYLFSQIPVIGGWLASHADAIIAPGAVFLIQETESTWTRLQGIITRPGYEMNQMAQALTNIASTLHGNIAHLQNTVIPNAQSAATSSSNSYTDSKVSTVEGQLNSAIADEHQDVSSLQNNINTLQAYVEGPFLTKIDNDISAGTASAEAEAHAELAQFESEIVGRLSQDENVIANLESIVNQVIPADIAAAMGTAVADSYANTANAVAIINNQITALQTTLEQAIAEDDTKLQEEITGNIDILQNELDGIQSKQQLDEANIGVLQEITSVAIPAAIAAVATSVAAITTEYDECAITMCPGPHSLQNVLAGLLATLLDAGELGFIVEAVRDPIATANALSPILTSVDAGANDLWDTLLALV